MTAERAIFTEFSPDSKQLKGGWNTRVFTNSDTPTSSGIQCDFATGIITLVPGEYHLTGLSTVAYNSGGEPAEMTTVRSPASAGYARLRTLGKKPALNPAMHDIDNADPSVICVGSPCTANLAASIVDAYFETDTGAQVVLEHQSGSNPESIYLRVFVQDSKWHAMARLNIRRCSIGIALALSLSLLTSSPGRAQDNPETWTIDPNHSAAQFAVKHLLVSTVRGQFDKTTGTIQWDGKDPTKIVANVTIDAASVNTRVENRDKDLRSDNFFDVAKYPTIAFVSKKVEAAGAGHLKMTGDLTMHGVTKEVVLDVDGPGAPIKQGQSFRVGASATTKVNRHDWGLNYSRAVELAPVVGDEITITIDIEATRRATP